jgi:hypothetical protein
MKEIKFNILAGKTNYFTVLGLLVAPKVSDNTMCLSKIVNCSLLLRQGFRLCLLFLKKYNIFTLLTIQLAQQFKSHQKMP